SLWMAGKRLCGNSRDWSRLIPLCAALVGTKLSRKLRQCWRPGLDQTKNTMCGLSGLQILVMPRTRGWSSYIFGTRLDICLVLHHCKMPLRWQRLGLLCLQSVQLRDTAALLPLPDACRKSWEIAIFCCLVTSSRKCLGASQSRFLG